MEDIRVIPSDLDGGDLRRQKARSKYFIRCDGSNDADDQNDAIQSAGKKSWAGLGEGWTRIYGDNHG
jgi:hypothetical protein